MVLLYILITVILLFIVLLFTVASKIIFHFDSVSLDTKLTLLWLYPLLRSTISSENNRFILNAYLLNKKVLSREMASSKMTMQNRRLLKKINPTDININAQYGFKDPYFTGLAYGLINMISQFFSVESLHQNADFLAYNDYINVEGTAKLNIGRSLLKLV